MIAGSFSRTAAGNRAYPSVLTPETEVYNHVIKHFISVLEGILLQLSLVVSKVFVASETVSYSDGCGGKFEDMESLYIH